MTNLSHSVSGTGRPNLDIPTILAAVAAVPGLVLIVLNANRLGPIHLIPVIAAILPFVATGWKTAVGLRAVAVGLFGIIVVLGAMSVGVFFAPSAGFAVWGVVRALGRYDEEKRTRQG